MTFPYLLSKNQLSGPWETSTLRFGPSPEKHCAESFESMVGFGDSLWPVDVCDVQDGEEWDLTLKGLHAAAKKQRREAEMKDMLADFNVYLHHKVDTEIEEAADFELGKGDPLANLAHSENS